MRELVVRSWLSDEELIITSDEHPFYVLGKGFISASELKTNDQLVSLDFHALTGVSNQRIKPSMPIYNFEVEDYHTYFVGKNELRIHNNCDDFAKAVYRLGIKVDKIDIIDGVAKLKIHMSRRIPPRSATLHILHFNHIFKNVALQG